MCVVNKQFELLKFVFDSVYVNLQYDEIYFSFTAGSVVMWSSGLSIRLLWYPTWMWWCCDCDGCTVVCVACVYAVRVEG